MQTITPELKEAIEQAGGQPVRLEDPQTCESYVLLRAADYDRLKQVGDEEDRRSTEGMLPGISEVFEDWNDPAMDAYNDLDPRR